MPYPELPEDDEDDGLSWIGGIGIYSKLCPRLLRLPLRISAYAKSGVDPLDEAVGLK